MTKKYEYKFVSIESSGWTGKPKKEDYQKTIQEYAKNGWRFVQIFGTSKGFLRTTTPFYELIFEREI